MNLLEFCYRKPNRRAYEMLRKAHTRQLLKWLDASRACGGSYDIGYSGVYTTTDELKTELSKREHVPNKDEARVIRQRKAFAKQHR